MAVHLGDVDPDLNYFNVGNQCNFYSSDSFNDIDFDINSFNIVHLNVRSCNKNLDELMLNLKNFNMHFSIVVLTETWLNSLSDWIDLPGFNAFHSIREGRPGGGVTIMVRSYLSVECVPAFTLVSDCHESICIDVTVGGRAITILGTYCPPGASLEIFNTLYFVLSLNYYILNGEKDHRRLRFW